MKTLTITEARKNLGRWLSAAARGEDIGIISGADVIALRKVAVESVDYAQTEYQASPEHVGRVVEAVDQRYQALTKKGQLKITTAEELRKLVHDEVRRLLRTGQARISVMKRSRKWRIPCLGGLLVLCATMPTAGVRADVTMPAIFSDHLVLQRDASVPIWGQAAPGEKVTVKIGKQEKTVRADNNGAWLINLNPLAAGGPYRLLVIGVPAEATGQAKTNVVEDVLVGEVWVGSGQSNMAGPVGGYAKKDEVLAAAAAAAPYPRIRLLKTGGNMRWSEAKASSVNGFSAILFYFGLRLHKQLDVPVGLIVGAVGGTPSGLWLSKEALRADPTCQVLIQKYAAAFNDAKKKHEAAIAKWEKAAAAAKQHGKREPRRPRPPPTPGDTSRGPVGGLYERYIRPVIPYCIRGVLWDQGEGGTALPMVDQYSLMGALIRGWRKDWKQDFPFIYIQKPSGGGCAWDRTQPVTSKGESIGALPNTVPNDGGYVENHIKIMNYPNTAMAISSDLGPGVHPVNKSGYAHRAGDVALGMVYGQQIEYYGPIYDSHKIAGNQVRIHFKHAGQGLAFKHAEKLQGFAVAGADRVYRWADASIDGDTVLVSCDQVTQPVAVRYAWSVRRRWANLFNQDGLPAVPFRTDDW